MLRIALKKMKRIIHRIRSFTLVELSMVLVIISLVSGSIFQIMNRKTEADRIKDTNATLDKIESALAHYVAINKRLPCPADASQSIFQANFGIATRNTSNDEQCDGTTGFSNPTYPNLSFGTVPTKSLWIDDKLAFDAWKNKIMYVMIQHCNANAAEHATNHFSSNSCGVTNTTGQMTIESASGSTITNDAILVLISFGPNGHGSFPRGGGLTRNLTTTNPGTDELDNSMYTGAGAMGTIDNIFVQKSPTVSPDYFDDIVRYKTRYQLIRDAGMSTDQISDVCVMLEETFPNLSEDVIDIPNLMTTTGRTACDADATYCLPQRQVASTICGETTNTLCSYYLLHIAHYLKRSCFNLQS